MPRLKQPHPPIICPGCGDPWHPNAKDRHVWCHDCRDTAFQLHALQAEPADDAWIEECDAAVAEVEAEFAAAGGGGALSRVRAAMRVISAANRSSTSQATAGAPIPSRRRRSPRVSLASTKQYAGPKGRERKDYEALFIEHTKLIAAVAGKRNKRPDQYDDLLGYIRLKLFSGRVIEKSQRKLGADVLDALVDAVGFCQLLGVSLRQQFAARRRGAYLPEPLNIDELPGRNPNNRAAIYRLMDVLVFVAGGDLPFRVIGRDIDDKGNVVAAERNEGAIKMPVSCQVTPAQFRGYLARAVHRHYANYCRTEARRHKERPVWSEAPRVEDRAAPEATGDVLDAEDSDTQAVDGAPVEVVVAEQTLGADMLLKRVTELLTSAGIDAALLRERIANGEEAATVVRSAVEPMLLHKLRSERREMISA